MKYYLFVIMATLLLISSVSYVYKNKGYAITSALTLHFSLEGQEAKFVGTAYGQSASSLEELENEVQAENSSKSNMSNYRIKLIDYMKNHNLSAFFPSNISQLDEVHTSTLEEIVKSHKQQCKSGTDDEYLASIKNNITLDLAGDC